MPIALETSLKESFHLALQLRISKFTPPLIQNAYVICMYICIYIYLIYYLMKY